MVLLQEIDFTRKTARMGESLALLYSARVVPEFNQSGAARVDKLAVVDFGSKPSASILADEVTCLETGGVGIDHFDIARAAGPVDREMNFDTASRCVWLVA
jgi:hypothetical protein